MKEFELAISKIMRFKWMPKKKVKKPRKQAKKQPRNSDKLIDKK